MNTSRKEATRKRTQTRATAGRGRKPLSLQLHSIALPRKPVTVSAPRASRSCILAPLPDSWNCLIRRVQQLVRIFVNFLSRKHTSRRKLQVLETQPLGEKRFISLVSVGQQKFLIGSAPNSIALLAEIATRRTTAISQRLRQESV
jgi:hypothetical protein